MPVPCTVSEHLPWKTSTSICCTPRQCTKRFSDPATFERELDVYQRGLDYVPRLVSSDPRELSLVVENVGTPLGRWTDTFRHLVPPALTRILPDHRREHAADVRALVERFRADTGLYHNDVQYKNVLRHMTGKLYLIDFEHSNVELQAERCHGRSCWNLDDIY